MVLARETIFHLGYFSGFFWLLFFLLNLGWGGPYMRVRLYRQYETLFLIHHSIIAVIAVP